MSAQYKMKKYLNKLENATDLAKMDAYYAKVRQYKMAQSGGVVGDGKWRTDLKDKVDLLDKVGVAQAQVTSYIDSKRAEIDAVRPNVDAFQKSYKTVEEGLADSLLFLNEIAKKIKESGALNMSEFDNIFLAISGIDPAKYPTVNPEDLWKWVFQYNLTAADLDVVLRETNSTDREAKAVTLKK